MKLLFSSSLLLLLLCYTSPTAAEDVKRQNPVEKRSLRKEIVEPPQAGDRSLNIAEDDSQSHTYHGPSEYVLQAETAYRASHDSGPITHEVSDNPCDIDISQNFFNTRGGNTPENRVKYIQQFKPCGYFKQHCSSTYADAPVIRNNVNYSTRKDVPDYERDTFIVQFDIGMRGSAYNLMTSLTNGRQRELFEVDSDNTWEKITVDQWKTYRFQDGEHGFPDPPTVGNGAALGEVCVEIPAKFYDDLGDIMGNTPTYDIGGCGEDDGTLAQIFWGKTCMQHDLCTVFKAVIQGNDHTQGAFCDDIDCGDEAMATITDCMRDNWGPDWAVGDYVDCPSHETADIYPYIGRATQIIDAIGGTFNVDSCYFWTGYETGMSTPAMAFRNGHSCSYDIECFSGNCPWGWTWVCRD